MIDVLMITHRRPRYTAFSVKHLLETCDDTMRVRIWHNGNHERTLAVVEPFLFDVGPDLGGVDGSPAAAARSHQRRPANGVEHPIPGS